jgi:hypothetical protein
MAVGSQTSRAMKKGKRNEALNGWGEKAPEPATQSFAYSRLANQNCY